MAVRCMIDIRSRKVDFNGKFGAIKVAGIVRARAKGGAQLGSDWEAEAIQGGSPSSAGPAAVKSI